MAREKPAFRDNMDVLLSATGGKQMIRVREAAKLLGVDHRTLLRDPSLNTRKVGAVWMVSVPVLARWMS